MTSLSTKKIIAVPPWSKSSKSHIQSKYNCAHSLVCRVKKRLWTISKGSEHLFVVPRSNRTLVAESWCTVSLRAANAEATLNVAVSTAWLIHIIICYCYLICLLSLFSWCVWFAMTPRPLVGRANHTPSALSLAEPYSPLFVLVSILIVGYVPCVKKKKDFQLMGSKTKKRVARFVQVRTIVWSNWHSGMARALVTTSCVVASSDHFYSYYLIQASHI